MKGCMDFTTSQPQSEDCKRPGVILPSAQVRWAAAQLLAVEAAIRPTHPSESAYLLALAHTLNGGEWGERRLSHVEEYHEAQVRG